MRVTFLGLARHDASWGFVSGFLTATGLYAIITSENPSHVPTMLLNTEHESFNRIAPREPNGRIVVSYTAFQREYNRVRVLFYLALLAFLLIVVIAMLRF